MNITITITSVTKSADGALREAAQNFPRRYLQKLMAHEWM